MIKEMLAHIVAATVLAALGLLIGALVGWGFMELLDLLGVLR